MRKTNIIYPNRTPNYPPLGALYLTDALEKQGIGVALHNSSITNIQISITI